MNEYRYPVGADGRLRMGPFSLDPTVLYQFGHRDSFAPATFAPSGAITGRRYNPNIDAWLTDIRAGYQLGPLLIEGLAMYTTGNTKRNNALGTGTSAGTIHYFQPLDLDTGYLAACATALPSLGTHYPHPCTQPAPR